MYEMLGKIQCKCFLGHKALSHLVAVVLSSWELFLHSLLVAFLGGGCHAHGSVDLHAEGFKGLDSLSRRNEEQFSQTKQTEIRDGSG